MTVEEYFKQAEEYRKQEKYDTAIEFYIKVIEGKPDYDRAYYNCLHSYIKLKNLSKIAANRQINKIAKLFVKGYKDIVDVQRRADKDNIDELIECMLSDEGHYVYKTLFKYGVKNEKDKESYHNIYIKAHKIVNLLQVNNEYEKQQGVAYYTQRHVAKGLLFSQTKDKTKNDNRSKFRLNSIVTVNDPKEGKVLFDYLGITNSDNDVPEYQAFLGCFTFNHECLNQFRLYGKTDGKEATGVSLVFNRDFFEEEVKSELVNEPPKGSEEKENDKKDDTKKYPLFRCVYIDPETKQVISLGQKEDYTFYRDESGYENLSEEQTTEIEEKIKEYKKDIGKILVAVKEEFKNLKDLINNFKDKRGDIVSDLLINLRYLVKHVAFKEEQECRIISVEPLDNDRICLIENQGMYIETKDVSLLIDKVCFGPRATGYKLFKDRIGYEGLNIKCFRCTHPYSDGADE